MQCAALSAALPAQVLTSDGAAYQSLLSSYWTLQEQSLDPSCFVQPATANDVSIAVKILSSYNGFEYGSSEQSNGCQFAIKSGGHTPFPGAANIESGVTIDLANINGIEIHPETKTASVGPGNRWGDVYSTLQSAGYSVPGGRDSTVGVGGLVTGGGISFFSPRVGLVCDAVTNFEVVLASGAIVNANISSNAQLFRALKGGSNNFGIVTKIDLPLLNADMWGGFLYTDVSERTAVFDFFEDFAKSDGYDPNAAFIDSHVLVNGSWILALQMTYTQPNVTNPQVFQPILDLPGQSTVRQATHFNLTKELGDGGPTNTRALWVTITLKNNAAFMETVFQLGNATAQSFADAEGLFFALSFQPLPQTIIQRAKTNGGDALGLDAEDGDLVIMNVGIFWSDESDDKRIYDGAWNLTQTAVAQAKEKDLWNEYVYLNYALRYQNLTQHPLRSYGSESFSMMEAVSGKYDPTGLFQRAVPGGHKLWS